jgi:hypothetical protein
VSGECPCAETEAFPTREVFRQRRRPQAHPPVNYPLISRDNPIGPLAHASLNLRMTYIVNLCFRAKGKRDYEHIGRVDIGKPLTRKPGQLINVSDRHEVRVRVDKNHLIPARPPDATAHHSCT